jgi:hypothetical protein
MVGPRRPLGAGVITLIVVDAVLVLVFVFLLGQNGYLNGLASPGGGSSSPSATPSVTAEAVTFASPTRNITCTITPDAANCEIAQFMYATPTLEGCSGDAGHEIEVTPDGAHWVCRTGTPPPTPSPDIANLDWGHSITASGYTCTSEHNGVTCTYDESGHSFSLARRAVTLT